MILSVEDGKLYYELWLPLLDFVNQKYKVHKDIIKMEGAENLDTAYVKEVSNKLCECPSAIDEYLLTCKEMPEEHQNIIKGWKRSIRGKFFIERHLKNGSILISMEDESIYQVNGINTSIEEMCYGAPMPIMMETILMPFRDIIITDGIIMMYHKFIVGGNMKKMLKDAYIIAKKNGKITKTL